MRRDRGSGGHERWLRMLESALEAAGPQGAEAAGYLRDHRTRIGIRSQSAGARWTVMRSIELHPQYAGDAVASPYALSLVVHEIRHLQQGALTALSVYGELDAWQAQFRFLGRLSVAVPGSESHRAVVARILELPLGWDRQVLKDARQLMLEYGGRAYRVDLLPLFPIHKEFLHAITGRLPG